ncbi:hypothetical protein IEE94_10070 [Yimella sp. cx-573]|nr:hypothetical protein [Yimella sp. cx-573]
MSSATHLGARRQAEHAPVAMPGIGSVRLAWQVFCSALAYEVHATQGRRDDWHPDADTLVGVSTTTRFVHRGLGPTASTWAYRVVAVDHEGVRFVTPVVTATTRTSVTVTGRPLATVGAFDGSGTELAMSSSGYVHYRTTFPRDVDFRYGFDRPEVHWSYVQPGPEDAWAGRCAHRFRLRFDLQDVPEHDVDFALWLVDRHPTRGGTAAVSVNGALVETLLFDDPLSDAAMRLVLPGAGAGPAVYERVIPRSVLQPGENVVDIVKDHGSWIAYDAIGVFARP